MTDEVHVDVVFDLFLRSPLQSTELAAVTVVFWRTAWPDKRERFIIVLGGVSKEDIWKNISIVCFICFHFMIYSIPCLLLATSVIPLTCHFWATLLDGRNICQSFCQIGQHNALPGRSKLPHSFIIMALNSRMAMYMYLPCTGQLIPFSMFPCVGKVNAKSIRTRQKALVQERNSFTPWVFDVFSSFHS